MYERKSTWNYFDFTYARFSKVFMQQIHFAYVMWPNFCTRCNLSFFLNDQQIHNNSFFCLSVSGINTLLKFHSSFEFWHFHQINFSLVVILHFQKTSEHLSILKRMHNWNRFDSENKMETYLLKMRWNFMQNTCHKHGMLLMFKFCCLLVA